MPQKWAFVFFLFEAYSIAIVCACSSQDYCAPKTDYAEVRKRVHYAFTEKANEIADAIIVVQSLSKEATKLLEEIDAQCG